MSYARFGENSDVYVYLDCCGEFRCCACSIKDEWGYATTDALLAHLEEHKALGHTVPDYCVEALKEEREENDAWIAAGGRDD